MTRSDEANARALKAALMTMGFALTAGRRFHFNESEAEAIVALAVQHLVQPPSEGLGK